MRFAEKLKDRIDFGYPYYNVAVIYRETKTTKEAVHWYELGIAHGDGDCASGLASMYLDGEGVKKDLRKGFEMLQGAVDSNTP